MNRTVRVALSVVTATLTACALLAACGGDDDASSTANGDPTDATLVLNWTPNAHHLGVYAAQEEGWYRDAGIDLEIVEPTEAGAEQAVGQGRAEFGISMAEGVLPAREQGIPVVSIGTILPVNDSALMSLASDGIAEPADLAGKLYGGYNGPLETELIDRLAACGGIDPASVEQVEVGNVDYLAGLEANRFDVVWIFNGWDAFRAREIEQADIGLIEFADHLDCIPNWYTPLFVTNEEMIEDQPDLVRTFMEVTTRGYELAIDDPDGAADLMMDAVPEMDEQLIRAAATYYAPRFTAGGAPFGTQDPATWSAFETFLVEAEALAQPVGVDAAYTNDFIPDERCCVTGGASLAIDAIAHTYDGESPVDALAEIDLHIPAGQFVALVGPSGCGKSTLLRIVAGLVAPTHGTATIGGQRANGRPGLAAYQPQRDLLMPWRRVLANATLGAEVAGVNRDQARVEATARLARFGLEGFERAWPATLSGGMRQRVALLRTFLVPQPLLLLDEPLGALDAITRRSLQAWLEEVWTEDGRTVVLVTHDVDEALLLADRVVVMSARPGRIVADVAVTFPRTREARLIVDPGFVELKARLLDALGT